jgi:hypothetical protein
MQGLLIEGISGAGKTTVLTGLRSRLPSLTQEAHLLFTEQYTQRLVTSATEKTGLYESVIKLLCHYVTFLEGLKRRYDVSIFSSHPRRVSIDVAFLFERFHLGQYILQGFEPDDAFSGLDDRLAVLGAKLVVLTIPENLIFERCVVSTQRFRGSGWKDYQAAWKLDNDGIVARYIDEQFNLLRLARMSAIPLQVIDTADQDWGRIQSEVFAFWQAREE